MKDYNFKRCIWLKGSAYVKYYGEQVFTDSEGNPSNCGWIKGGTCFTAGLTCLLNPQKEFIGKNDVKMYLFLIDKTSRSLEDNNNVWCPFTLEQIKEHIEEIRRMIDFDYKISDLGTSYVILIKFLQSKINHKQQYYVLLRVRYLYEFPYSGILLDAFRLKEKLRLSCSLDELFYRIVELLPVFDNSGGPIFRYHPVFYPHYHAAPNPRPYQRQNFVFDYDEEKLRSTIQNMKTYSTVNNLVPCHCIPGWVNPKFPPLEEFFDAKFWLLGFEYRFPTYEAHLHHLSHSDEELEYFKSGEILYRYKRDQSTLKYPEHTGLEDSPVDPDTFDLIVKFGIPEISKLFRKLGWEENSQNYQENDS